MKANNRLIESILVLVILISSCQKRDWNNPFDSACPKEIWTPTDFKAVQEGTTVKLTWSQPENNISGFKLTKKVDSGTAADLQNQTKGVNQFVDASLTGGELHTYTLVAYAGTNQSNMISLAITPKGPVGGVSTTAVVNITSTTVSSGGNILNDGGSPIAARGVCWGINTNPTTSGSKTTDGSGIGNFSSAVSGLTPNTTYFLRAYATNSVSTVYGNEVTFKTPLSPILFNLNKNYGSMTDIEGNTYKTIQIGTQLWMAENLKTTKYKDGTTIPLVTDNTEWFNLTTPGYCFYNNDASLYKNTYGALYNWFTVETNKLCPNGWHVPTDEEWKILSQNIGGDAVSAGKLKEAGATHWMSPNTGATNEVGFTALPGGFRQVNTFMELGTSGGFWSATPYPNWHEWWPKYASWFRSMQYSNTELYTGNPRNREFGNSVRCISGELSLAILATSISSSVTTTTAMSGGNITNDGGSSVTARGVCWSTSANPTISNSKTIDGTGIGTFSSAITGLTVGTNYFVRAYATNSAGTTYGNQVTFTTLTSSLPTSGLVAWYPFNGNANDESGNGNNGIVYGAVLTNDRLGNINRSYSFDGITSKIEVQDNQLLKFAAINKISISLWFKAIQPPIGVGAVFFTKQFGAGSTQQGINGGILIGNQNLCCIINNGSSGVQSLISTSSTQFLNNSWHHYVYTFDKGISKMYLDNLLIVSTTTNGAVIGDNTQNLIFGTGNPGNVYYFKGQLDDIGIWNRALTDQEVQSIYNIK